MIMKAPFTPDQVKALNAYQEAGMLHPFTCPGDHEHCYDRRELIATTSGWVCQCGRYTQDWAHDFMTNPSMLKVMTGDS
jgi:hypothetical protein